MRMDEHTETLLTSLEPKSPRPAVGRIVEDAAVDFAVRRQRRRTVVRMVPVSAAAAAVLLVAGWFLVRDTAAPPREHRPAASPESATVENIPRARGLAARASLLEMKISRLKDMAVRSKDTGKHLRSIHELEKRLRSLSSALPRDVGAAAPADRSTEASPEDNGNTYPSRSFLNRRNTNA